MKDAKIDVIQAGQFGAVANQLMANAMVNGKLDPGRMRPYGKINNKGQFVGAYVNSNGVERPVTNATLRKDEWKQYDEALLKAAKIRLNGVADLQSRGLTYNIANGFGKTVLEYEDMSEMGDAQVNMDGVTRGINDRVECNIKYLPLPIIHKGFDINARVLAASRTTGESLDTAQVTEATFKVSEKLEEILFTGLSSYTFGGGTIYGYTDFPSRITGSLTGNWDDLTDNSDGTVGQQILNDVLAMKQASINALHYGPWILYVPTNFETVLERDYVADYGKSIRNRILETPGIEAVKVADKLTADNVLLVQMTENVVRMVNAFPITNVEWQSEGMMLYHYKIMTIMVPQLRADANGNTGIVHYS
jgi:uncharacterized linocin/CFP29 family protein